MNKKSLALVAMSAIFFSSVGFILAFLPAVAGVHLELPWFGSNLFAAVPAVFGLISIGGCLLLFREEKNQSAYWSLGIPLCILTALTTIYSFLSPKTIITDIPSLGQNALVLFILLSPCAALFFYSEKKIYGGGWELVVISLLVSVVSAVLLYGWIFPHQYAPGERVLENPLMLLFWLNYFVGLPIVGALFLADANGTTLRDAKTGIPVVQNPPETP